MADVIFIVIMVAFFALAALFVTFCERIIGSGAAYEGDREEPPEVREAA
ncbi:MAG TPA: hypothetical protein VKL22_02890 [Actinomycetota bacterium]|nr:hypothetical protein [Actinomycetota bacterium]